MRHSDDTLAGGRVPDFDRHGAPASRKRRYLAAAEDPGDDFRWLTTHCYKKIGRRLRERPTPKFGAKGNGLGAMCQRAPSIIDRKSLTLRYDAA